MSEDQSVLGQNCRSGCKTKDHASYGECLRSCRIQIGPQYPDFDTGE